MNIMAELYRMNVSIIISDQGVKMAGERSIEAAARFKSQRENIIDEVRAYEPSLALLHGVEQKIIDQARAIASAWDWSEGDWGLYWDRDGIDFGLCVPAIYDAEQITHPRRYQ